jgi:hypothetical protein
MSRPKHLSLFLALTMAVAIAFGCRPSGVTPPDPITVAPRDNADVMQRVHDTLAWVLPGAASIARILPMPSAMKDVIVSALDRAAREGLPPVQRAISVYRERGGGTGACELSAASGALRELLLGVARATFPAGYGLAREIEQVLISVGGVLADVAPRCAVDAGFYSAAADDARVIAAARDRAAVELGHELRPYPPIPRENAR